MLLTPAAARPWLGPASRNRPWPGHGPMMVRRREALAVLYAAYGSWVRLALGTLAWGLGVAGGVLAGQGVAAGGEGPAASVAVGLLLLATYLGGAVVATGSALARAIAGWLTLATAVRADGGRVDGTPPDPDTLRTHEEVLAQDRAEGARELWRPPLLPRTLAALVLGAAGLVLAAQAALGFGEVSTPYAGQDARGAWLASSSPRSACSPRSSPAAGCAACTGRGCTASPTSSRPNRPPRHPGSPRPWRPARSSSPGRCPHPGPTRRSPGGQDRPGRVR